MTMTEKLFDTVKDFPESVIAEILDFAEFLREKRRSGNVELPNGELLVELKGGLESSVALAGNPAEIQEKLRNEWN